MKKLFILKLGGSIVTHKDRSGFSIRKSNLAKIAKVIKKSKDELDFDLILVHGAGGHGHSLAKEYGLKDGTKGDTRKIYGALLSRLANHKLNLSFTETFIVGGLSVVPVHTASVIIQRNGKIENFDLRTIRKSLSDGFIPVLYGDMVFDEEIGMSVCSGDAIVPYLANKLDANRIMYASDIDGIFENDPYVDPKAKLIDKLSANEFDLKKNAIMGSHNVDVTGGLGGKMKKILETQGNKLEKVDIFNGLKVKNFEKIFFDEKFPHTEIFFE